MSLVTSNDLSQKRHDLADKMREISREKKRIESQLKGKLVKEIVDSRANIYDVLHHAGISQLETLKYWADRITQELEEADL